MTTVTSSAVSGEPGAPTVVTSTVYLPGVDARTATWTALTVTKRTPAIAWPAGQVVQRRGSTASAAEVWEYVGGTTLPNAPNYGLIVADFGGTGSILVPGVVILGGAHASPPVGPVTPNGTGAWSGAAGAALGCVALGRTNVGTLSGVVVVAKPSAATWNSGQGIYRMTTAGVSSYTNSLVAVLAADDSEFLGTSAASYAAGTTQAVVVSRPWCDGSPFFQGPSVDDGHCKTVTATAINSPFPGSSVYSNAAITTVSGSYVSGYKLLGYCLRKRKVSAGVYQFTYSDSGGNGFAPSLVAALQSGGLGAAWAKAFTGASPNRLIAVRGAGWVSGAAIGLNYAFGAHYATRYELWAQTFIAGKDFGDVAFDPSDAPAPFDNVRIIWSPDSITTSGSAILYTPRAVNRSTSVAPYAGTTMKTGTRPAGRRRGSDTSFGSATGYFLEASQPRPHIANAWQPTTCDVTPPSLTFPGSSRLWTVPSSIDARVYSYPTGIATLEYRWTILEYGATVSLSGWSSFTLVAAGAADEWSATIVPPTWADPLRAAQPQLEIRVNGGASAVATSSASSVTISGYGIALKWNAAGVRYHDYPWSVRKVKTWPSDGTGAIVDHIGWRSPDPALPALQVAAPWTVTFEASRKIRATLPASWPYSTAAHIDLGASFAEYRNLPAVWIRVITPDGLIYSGGDLLATSSASGWSNRNTTSPTIAPYYAETPALPALPTPGICTVEVMAAVRFAAPGAGGDYVYYSDMQRFQVNIPS